MHLPNLCLLLFLRSISGFEVGNKTMLQRYCELDPKNTPCLACGDGSQSDCLGNPPKFHLIQNFLVRWLLNRHNDLRNKLYQFPGLQEASNMNVLSWDQEAEFFAICHVMRHQSEHDAVRISLSGQKLGQNMYHAVVNEGGGTVADWALQAADKWMEEGKSLEKSQLNDLCRNYTHLPAAEGFTQMLWADTLYIGCAYDSNRVGKEFHHYIFCNYQPTGNVVGEAMYKPGKISCKNRNKHYNKLCGDERPMYRDPFKFPLVFEEPNRSGSQTIRLNTLIFSLIFCYLS